MAIQVLVEDLVYSLQACISNVLTFLTIGIGFGVWAPILLVFCAALCPVLSITFEVVNLLRRRIVTRDADQQMEDASASSLPKLERSIQTARRESSSNEEALVDLKRIAAASRNSKSTAGINQFDARLFGLQKQYSFVEDAVIQARENLQVIQEAHEEDEAIKLDRYLVFCETLVAHIISPVPTSAMSKVTTICHWFSIGVVLLDIGFGIGSCAVFVVLIVGHTIGSRLKRYREKMLKKRESSAKASEQASSEQHDAPKLMADPAAVRIEMNAIAEPQRDETAPEPKHQHITHLPASAAQSVELGKAEQPTDLDGWGAAQDEQLVAAAATYPSSMGVKARWNAISLCVDGKSTVECAKRFKELKNNKTRAREVTSRQNLGIGAAVDI